MTDSEKAAFDADAASGTTTLSDTFTVEKNKVIAQEKVRDDAVAPAAAANKAKVIADAELAVATAAEKAAVATAAIKSA